MEPPCHRGEILRAPTVLFQITAIGRNYRALAESARSVLYWARHTPRQGFVPRLWLVVEPDGYAASPATYDALQAEGARVLVVPRRYATPLGTHGKARALQYATEVRQHEGLSTDRVWVYHQDEETCVGEDTFAGIAEFVRDGSKQVGVGIIVYPLDWNGSPSHVQEVTRSYDDFRVLDSMTGAGNSTAGFHGSHILARADVEDAVGWDTVGYAPAEDLTFEIRVRARFGSVFGVLKGFAYEKGAFSLRDQLRQRRRWMHGVLFALRRSSELPRSRRLSLGYSAVSWFSALPSIAVLALGVAFHFGPVLFVTGLFTGFVWISMVTAYLEGYRLHAPYLRRKVSWLRLVGAGLVGALIDALAPWYALATRPSLGDFIAKDRPGPAGAPAPAAAPRGGAWARAPVEARSSP
ncbi:MAG TPA: glycosyltransferase family 2 protein [Thermoplasmata archaeon]|nr:glycosyltransferase family 2 protein [Thermoplasmata archaeon]